MQLRLEGPSLEKLLLEVEDSYDGGATIVAAEKVRRGGIGGFFSREHFEVTVDVPEAAAVQAGDEGPLDLLDLADSVTDEVSVSTQDESFGRVLERLQTLTRDPYAEVEPAPAPAPVPVQRSEPRPFAWPTADLAELAPRTLPEPEPPAPKAERRSPSWNALKLRSLGVPADLVADAPCDGLDELVQLVCSRLPSVPGARLGRGEVAVVLGDGPACLATARAYARHAGLPGSAVKLGSPVSLGPDPRLATPEAVHRQRLAWAGLAHPTVVALAGLAAANQAWLQSALLAAAPTRTLLCVPATMKPTDAKALIRRLEPDALVLTDHAASGDPATVLGLGLPVVMLDTEWADPEAWQRLLTARTRK